MTMAQLAEQTHGSLEHPDRWLPRLRRVLDAQHALYAELDGLSRLQAGLIESGDTSGLINLLSSRQVLIDQIATLNADLDPFVRSWARLLAQVLPDQRTELERRIASIDALIAGIARRDDDDRKNLDTRRRAASDSIGAAARARAATSAYGADLAGRTPHVPRYQDREA